jgi:hypothetical protein
MDVLFNTAKTKLLPGNDLHGNNRLRVMITLQSATYKNADDDSKEKTAENLVGTIENFWGGRMLAQVPGRRARRGGAPGEEAYVQLEKIHSIQAIKHLLSGEGDSDEEGSVGEKISMKQGRRASLKAIQSISSTAGETSASILPSTLPTLPDDMQHLRSAAVKSLQKRKQRQGLNSKIRGLTANKAAIFQDGNGSASVVSSGMSTTAGSAAPPVVVAPVPTTVTSNRSQQNGDPNFRHYRQTSSGASVASTVTQMSSNTSAGPGTMQRQSSVGGMSTASTNTAMSMNTVNAARTISSITARQAQNIQAAGASISQNMMQPSSVGGFSEYNVPPNITMAGPPNQFQQHPHLGMPSVPENFNNDFSSYDGPVNTDFPGPQNQYYDNNGGQTAIFAGERNSLLNSTGSDGLPRFGQGEVELLMKGLEMAEQQQQEQEQQQYRQQQQQRRFE